MAWEIDTVHSGISFRVRHLGISAVRGQFKQFSGTVDLNEADPTQSRGRIEIDVASINSHDEKRDGHLRSPDFFDVATFPTAVFETTNIRHIEDDRYQVQGNFTLHGVTRPLEFEATFSAAMRSPFGDRRSGVSAEFKINRGDYGLTWNQVVEAGKLVVGEVVTLTVDAELVDKVPARASA